jgi:hypothetical protein
MVGSRATERVLGVLTAAALAVDAYVHFSDAGSYEAVTSSVVSEATLFRAQAAAAVVIAAVLLVRPRPVAWVLAVLVAGAALGAVLLYTYVDVGALGPLPNLYEPTWQLPGKAASAVAEGIAVVLALAGTAVSLRRRTADRATAAGAQLSSPRPAA